MCFEATVQIFFSTVQLGKLLKNNYRIDRHIILNFTCMWDACILYYCHCFIQRTKWINLSGSQAVNLIFLYQSPVLFFSFLITHRLSQPCWMPMACPDLPSHWLPPNSRVQGQNNLYLFNKSLKAVMLCSTLFFSPFSLPIPFSQRSC